MLIKKLVSCILIVSFFLAATSCASFDAKSGGEKGAKVIRVTLQRAESKPAMIDYIMKEKGFFKKYLPEDVIIEYSTITSPADKRDALVSEQLDITFMSLTVLMGAIDKDLPLLPLASTVRSDFFMYTNKKYPHLLADLEPNDKISVSSSLGVGAHLAFMTYCLEQYDDANYFNNMVGMSVPDVMASMSSTEDLSAAIMEYPFGREDQAEEIFEQILDLSPYTSEYAIESCWATSQSFYNNNPAYIEALYSALRDTVDFINTQPEEAAAIMQKYWTTYSIEEIVAIFKATPPSLEISESAYNKLANFMYDIDLLESPPKPLSELPNYDSLPLIP